MTCWIWWTIQWSPPISVYHRRSSLGARQLGHFIWTFLDEGWWGTYRPKNIVELWSLSWTWWRFGTEAQGTSACTWWTSRSRIGWWISYVFAWHLETKTSFIYQWNPGRTVHGTGCCSIRKTLLDMGWRAYHTRQRYLQELRFGKMSVNGLPISINWYSLMKHQKYQPRL